MYMSYRFRTHPTPARSAVVKTLPPLYTTFFIGFYATKFFLSDPISLISLNVEVVCLIYIFNMFTFDHRKSCFGPGAKLQQCFYVHTAR